MRKRNDNGFIHVVAYLLILIIFLFTIYACLDILNLIDVPEKYSIDKWLSQYRTEIAIEGIENYDNDTIEQAYKKVKVEIEDKTRDRTSDVQSPIVSGYQSEESSYSRPASNGFLYYDQLDEYGKIIYTELEKNLDNMKTGIYNVKFNKTFNDLLHEENGEEVLNNSFQLAINALNFDRPDLFYLDISKIYLLTKITTQLWMTTYEVEIGANQGQSYLNDAFSSEEDVNRAIANIEREKDNIKATLSGGTERQIKGVHDYLVDRLEYDSTVSRSNIYNIYGALINRCTVCEGYARAFKYLMDDLNIPCLIACGIGINNSGENESHAWNYVMLSGTWYAIDVTWDDPIIVGNGRVGDDIKYRYYLKGSNDFFKNHTESGDIVLDSNFKYPEISVRNY